MSIDEVIFTVHSYRTRLALAAARLPEQFHRTRLVSRRSTQSLASAV